MFNLNKQQISERDLNNSYVGFSIYNANAEFKGIEKFVNWYLEEAFQNVFNEDSLRKKLKTTCLKTGKTLRNL